MRKLWLRSLALSLGLVVTGARGQEAVWRAPQKPAPGSTAPPPSATLGKPIAIASSQPRSSAGTAAPIPASAPAASLGQPVAIAASRPAVDPNVQPVGFSTRPVFRGASPEQISARPMPSGMPSGMPGADNLGPFPGYHNWKKPGEEATAIPVSRNGAEFVAPPPTSGGGMLVAPTPVPGTGAAPGGAPMPGPMMGTAPIMTPGNAPMPGGMVMPPTMMGANNSPYPHPTVISGPPVVAHGGAPCGCAPSPTNCCNQGGGSCGGNCQQASQGAWGGCGCCDGPMFILGSEFLLWWTKGDRTPPLVSISAPNNPTGTFLDDPNSTVVYGGRPVGEGARPGGRLYGTFWLSDDHCWGVDVSGFFLGSTTDGRFEASDTGANMRIGRPFFDQAPIVPDPTTVGPLARVNPRVNLGNAELVAGLPTENTQGLIGSIQVSRQSSLWGFDANVRRNLWCSDMLYVDALVGFRQLGLDESIGITENLIAGGFPTNPAILPQNLVPVGTNIIITDRFKTQNRFYGGQVGFDSEMRFGDFTLGVKGKLGIGTTQQFVQIRGDTTVGGVTAQGGLLALQGTNIGNYSKKVFGVVPEVGMTLGYDVFDWWRVFAGYNFLYWNSVARPGEQINLSVNRNFRPGAPASVAGVGPAQPSFNFNSSSFYAHGLTFGMEFRY